MSVLQWFGIWGMTGFPEPEKEDVSKWSMGIDRVLGDERGQHHFGEFLNRPEHGLATHAQIFELWRECNKLLNEGASVNVEKAQEIHAKAEALVCLGGPSCDFSSLQDAQIREKVGEIQIKAIEVLGSVHDKFIASLPK